MNTANVLQTWHGEEGPFSNTVQQEVLGSLAVLAMVPGPSNLDSSLYDTASNLGPDFTD